MNEPITNAEDAVAVLGALPVPQGAERLTDAERDMVLGLIADARPASSGLLLSFAESVRNRREHDHPEHEDWYCLNLAAYMGEKTAPVLRRLVDVEAENERLRARIAELEAARGTVYRAEHPDSGIVLETYSDLGQARLHCEASAGRDSALSAATLSWIDDEEDGVYELVAELARDTEVVTGYIVTAVAVASEYDEEADE